MKPSVAQNYSHRWLTFTTGAFLGFLVGVILGLSSCQSAACPSSLAGRAETVSPVTFREAGPFTADQIDVETWH